LKRSSHYQPGRLNCLGAESSNRSRHPAGRLQMSHPRENIFGNTTRKQPWPKVLLALVAFVSGCSVGPNYRTPVVETPSAYKEAADWKPAQPNDQNLGGNWWTIFNDPQLNELELQV